MKTVRILNFLIILIVGVIAFTWIPETVTAQTVQMLPEWQKNSIALVSWLDFDEYYLDFVSKAVKNNRVCIIVDSNIQKHHVEDLIHQHRIPGDNIEFLTCLLDDLWVVDYSPLVVSQDYAPRFVDFNYFRSFDDQFPGILSSIWDVKLETMPLTMEGGNIMTDGSSNCFTTTEILDQNPKLSEIEIKNLMKKHLGCNEVHILKKLDDGTGHIDMFAKLLNPDMILLGQYEPEDFEYDVLEYNARYLAGIEKPDGSQYCIHRIPMPGIPDDYYTYTNSLILNDSVFVPVYHLPSDEDAIQLYSLLMPDHEIIPINSVDPICSGGAVHCTTKAIPDFIFRHAGVPPYALERPTSIIIN